MKDGIYDFMIFILNCVENCLISKAMVRTGSNPADVNWFGIYTAKIITTIA